ncbi:McrB family protein [Clostridium beijerinckii]|uniref:McrB family protein n=1 Tax=Clostridium beijerinckii TaxID=1520 RepID=UPI0002F97944|nr:AAA family ATPase [Clostridium beijerinckii]
MSKVGELLREAIPSSFVFSDLKIKTDNGSGEAKLHLGPLSKSVDYDKFFNDYDAKNNYYFEQANIIEYLNYMKLEYSAQIANEYKNVDKKYNEKCLIDVKSLTATDYYMKIEKFTDKSRYYIRAAEPIFSDIFRKIGLPLITNLKIEKYDMGTFFEYKFLLEPNWDYSKLGKHGITSVAFQHNRILFGAPGTGKSNMLKLNAKGYKYDESTEKYVPCSYSFVDKFERVTFHPNYSYAQFVGTYKPCSEKITKTAGASTITEDIISYKYVPGPFLRVLVKSYQNSKENYLLIIEEINRANVAAVFGDVFQLLDRKSDGRSEYTIQSSEDLKTYLASQLEKKWGTADETKRQELRAKYDEIHIPSNMYIWATMNSADQGVFPVDTAFKRRWSFEYIDINMGELNNDATVTFPDGRSAKWNDLRHKINDKLADIRTINEDKFLGPFFLSEKDLFPDNFDLAFKSKLLMYLFEDVVKHKRDQFFDEGVNTYSKLLKRYSEIGADVIKELNLNYIVSTTPSVTPTASPTSTTTVTTP